MSEALELFGDDTDPLQRLIEIILQELSEAEISKRLGVGLYEQRSEGRRGYRKGYKPRRLKTRVGGALQIASAGDLIFILLEV